MAEEEREDLDLLELEDNLSEVEKPPEVPAGIYPAEVQDVQVQTSAAGNRYFAVKLRIAPENLPANISEHYEDGAVLYWNRQIVPGKGDRRALFNLRKLIEAFGLDSNTTSINPNEWMGAECRVRVKADVYQGESRAQISGIESASGAAPAPKAAPKPAAKGRARR